MGTFVSSLRRGLEYDSPLHEMLRCPGTLRAFRLQGSADGGVAIILQAWFLQQRLSVFPRSLHRSRQQPETIRPSVRRLHYPEQTRSCRGIHEGQESQLPQPYHGVGVDPRHDGSPGMVAPPPAEATPFTTDDVTSSVPRGVYAAPCRSWRQVLHVGQHPAGPPFWVIPVPEFGVRGFLPQRLPTKDREPGYPKPLLSVSVSLAQFLRM